jgi:haloalkane dehalogenase
MQIFIGMWKPTAKWIALGAAARTAYLSKVSAATRLKLGGDAESIAWGHNDDVSTKDTFTFFCIWRFPRREMSDQYRSILAENGWDEYFTTTSLRGDPKTPFDVLTQHVTL